MVEIKVLLWGRFMPFHCCSHIYATITDLNSGEAMLVEYGAAKTSYLDISASTRAQVQREENMCCVGVVNLYSSKNLAEFKRLYQQKYHQDDYSFCFRNCADAVNFVLDHFFENKQVEDCVCLTWRLLCCIGCIGTLALACFPSPPPIVSPRDVYQKAYLLSCRFGYKPEIDNEANLLPSI